MEKGYLMSDDLTSCCNAYSTYFDDELVCKVCLLPVPFGVGDGGGAFALVDEETGETFNLEGVTILNT